MKDMKVVHKRIVDGKPQYVELDIRPINNLQYEVIYGDCNVKVDDGIVLVETLYSLEYSYSLLEGQTIKQSMLSATRLIEEVTRAFEEALEEAYNYANLG